MNIINKMLLIPALSISVSAAHAQQTKTEWNTPSAGNPFIPGYFADPTIRKFGDTYYIYATTDGTGNGYGPAQVWMSKDFINWRNAILNWPTTEVVWAPDVVQQKDGKYRYYYCEPCVIHAGESDSPLGPWRNILGDTQTPLVADRFVTNCITLDPQLFIDDDGSQYLYFGTWGIYDGFGCGVAKLAADGKSFDDKKLIPNTQVKDFFEAPFVFKKDGIYYFTYSSGSCHDNTYRVQYAISKDNPMGPYEYKGCILSTNSDGTIHGPGHHSILVDGENYYIVYHRHNNPHSIHGFHRQVCIDKMEFDSNGDIKTIVPTHDGIIPASLAKNTSKSKFTNLAFGATVTTSSAYSDWFKPEYAVDDNNATLWRASKCNGEEWIQLDLGKIEKFNQIWTQFEYATFFYQYKIETSVDGKTWQMYADRTNNTTQGSPMIDSGECKARYVRITITDTQKNGHFAAIWNIKIYKATKKSNPQDMLPTIDNIDYAAVDKGYPSLHKKDVEVEDRQKTAAIGNKIIDINADDYARGKAITVNKIANRTGGSFSGDKNVVVEIKNGKYAFFFNGQQTMTSDFGLPKTMTYNAPYTVSAWVLNPKVERIETVAEFTTTRNDLSTIELRQGSDRANGLMAHNASFENSGAAKECLEGEGKWQHWTVSFDGYNERIYLNGKLIQEKNMFLMIRPGGHITLGASMDGGNKFSGYLHSLQFYDKCLTENEIKSLYTEKSDTEDTISFDGELSLSLRPISPTLLSATITDEKGEKIETGLLSFRYAITSDLKAENANDYGEATNSSTAMLTTTGKGKQKCFVRITDDSGKFSKTLSAVVNMNPNMFVHFTDDFTHFASSASKVADYKKDIATWDGIIANESPECNTSAKAENGTLTLSSANTDFNMHKDRNGVLLYEEVVGDFIMQGKVVELDGQEKHATPAYNEGGIMVLDDSDENSQNIVHLGVFPNYNCGNMLTVVSRKGRPQFPNGFGWNYDPYLQIERVGNMFYARTSKDGKSWTDMPGSPVECKQLEGKRLKVGLYQTTYSANHSWVSFSDFHLWQKK